MSEKLHPFEFTKWLNPKVQKPSTSRSFYCAFDHTSLYVVRESPDDLTKALTWDQQGLIVLENELKVDVGFHPFTFLSLPYVHITYVMAKTEMLYLVLPRVPNISKLSVPIVKGSYAKYHGGFGVKILLSAWKRHEFKFSELVLKNGTEKTLHYASPQRI